MARNAGPRKPSGSLSDPGKKSGREGIVFMLLCVIRDNIESKFCLADLDEDLRQERYLAVGSPSDMGLLRGDDHAG